MAVASILQSLFLNIHYLYAFLALVVGLGGILLFLREALIDYHRHAAPRFHHGNMDSYSYLDE